MHKLRVLLIEVIGLGLLIGWLMWKYPELIDDIIPWVALLFLWHVTYEFILDTRFVRRKATALQRAVKPMIAWPLVIVIGSGVSLFYWWTINKSLQRLAAVAATRAAKMHPPASSPTDNSSTKPPLPPPPIAQAFHVVFATELLNMQHDLEHSALWVLYNSVYGVTVAPVQVLAYIEITSLYSHPVNISSYSVAIKTKSCGWIPLIPIDARVVKLLWGNTGLGTAELIDLEKNSFDYLWNDPIQPNSTQFGKLLFASEKSCDIKAGNKIQIKISLEVSTGSSQIYESSPVVVLDKVPTGSMAGKSQLATLDLVGHSVDATGAHRKLYLERVPDKFDGNKGIAVIAPNGKIGTIGLPRGAYILDKIAGQ